MNRTSHTPNLGRLLEIMARLRDPEGGCPWDVEQTFRTIAPYTIEEAYEVAEAIEQGDMAALKDELGDLLLQVVFHARMAEETEAFDFEDVAEFIGDKMIRRHPHVFGEEKVASVAAQSASWEAFKAEERAAKASADGGTPSALDGVTVGLPALARALKLQKRAARVGFDWPEAVQVFDKLDEELLEIKEEIESGSDPRRVEDEIGDLLFVVVNLARHLHVDPESALRHANGKFERRFRAMEQALAADEQPLEQRTLEEMEAAWQAVKRGEK
jgi:MazG family protein